MVIKINMPKTVYTVHKLIKELLDFVVVVDECREKKCGRPPLLSIDIRIVLTGYQLRFNFFFHSRFFKTT